MVVNEVELVAHLEEREQVLELPVAVPDVLARRRVERRDELGVRLGIAGGKQRDVDTRLDEAVGEQLHDGLDAAVARRRDGEPDGAEQRDAHSQRVLPRRRFPPSVRRSRTPGSSHHCSLRRRLVRIQTWVVVQR